jgi:hypothetical protein
MGDEFRHYVAYHNTERMGRTFSSGDPFRVLTNKSVRLLQESVVWLIVGEGRSPRCFSLGSVFRVNDTGDAQSDGFKHYAAGRGQMFDPPLSLNECAWFHGFRQALNSFQFGIQPLTDEAYIGALTALAGQAGASVF